MRRMCLSGSMRAWGGESRKGIEVRLGPVIAD